MTPLNHPQRMLTDLVIRALYWIGAGAFALWLVYAFLEAMSRVPQ